MKEFETIDILGVKINRLTQTELMGIIKDSLSNKIRTKIFTPNTEMLSKATREESLKILLNSADISVADGIGVVIASKILGIPLSERLPGIEIGEEIMELSANKQYKVFLLGSKDSVLKKAKFNLERKYKDLKICGMHEGYFDVTDLENEKVINAINDSCADILFVCMGYPRQEQWINDNFQKLSVVKVAIGLGGSIDVWSGETQRAPKIFRALYLEWLWRMCNDIKRVRFLTLIPSYFVNVCKQRRSFMKNDGKNAHIQPFFNKK